MDLLLKPDLREFIQSRMKTGRYCSETEVVEEALRLLEQALGMYALDLETLRSQIAEGLTSLDRGEGTDGDDFFDDLDASLR